MTRVLIKKGKLDTDKNTGRMPTAPTNQESGLEEILPSQPSEGNNPIDLILVASRTVR